MLLILYCTLQTILQVFPVQVRESFDATWINVQGTYYKCSGNILQVFPVHLSMLHRNSPLPGKIYCFVAIHTLFQCYTDCEVQSQLTYVSRLSEDEVHEFIRLECQCGECAIDEFVAGKDCKKSTPRSVPRLRITTRDLGQKMLNRQEMRFSDYKNSLKDKNNEIRTEYTCLLLNTMQELKTKCSLEIAKQRVRSLLTPKDSLGSQYKRMYKRELDKRLKDVQTYEELQQFLEQFCSWFNIDFIADLRKVLLGYDSQDPMVVTYKENLMRYLQRCCFQLTVCDLEGQAEHNEIICKTSTDFHEIKEEQHDIFERRLRQCIFIPVSERRIAECGEEMVFRMQEPLPPTTIKDPYVMNLWPLKYSVSKIHVMDIMPILIIYDLFRKTDIVTITCM